MAAGLGAVPPVMDPRVVELLLVGILLIQYKLENMPKPSQLLWSYGKHFEQVEIIQFALHGD
jgi:hypothetical protein